LLWFDFSFSLFLKLFKITKGNIIENIYRENGSLWFPLYLKSAVLVVDRKNRVHKVDPTFNSDQLSDQIHLYCSFLKTNNFLGKEKGL